jgi:DNA-directed RNA polymerase subunit H (RpoH/RPB5)
MSSTNRIVQIYNSRKTILDILNTVYNYDVEDYNQFTINEIDAMITNDQLDMLLTHKMVEGQKKAAPFKTYIKYYLKPSLNDKIMEPIIEDLFQFSEVLSKEDTLIVIFEGEPNDSIKEYLKTLFIRQRIFVVVHNIMRLQFNILEHSLVPKAEILDEKESEQIKTTYHLELKHFPEISRFDPQALAICLRPGQVCRFIRSSRTSLQTFYYRVCV